MSDAFGALNRQLDVGVELDLPTAGVYAKWDNFIDGAAGPDDLIRVDDDNAEIVVEVNGKGIYHVTVTFAGSASPQSLITSALFVNGIRRPRLQTSVRMGGAQDRVGSSFDELISLVPGDILDVRFNSSSNNGQLILHHISFVVEVSVRSTL